MSTNLNLIASLAGVSVSTVSKAFSGSSEISEKTRQHIFDIAKKHGLFDKYNKNKFSKKVIGVICPEILSDYYNMLVSILNREINAKNCIMTMSIGNFDAKTIEELFSYYVSYCRVDGIIIVGSDGDIKNPFLIPAVAIGSTKAYENIDIIKINLAPAIRTAIGYLKEMGHTKIGFAGEKLTHSKLDMFEQAMLNEQLPIEEKWIKTSSQRFEEAGSEIAESWLSEGRLPTAILAAYDYIAIGIIKTLKKRGIRVPEDVSVIGIDDISIAPYLETSLSSIQTHHTEACQKVLELILKKFENRYYSVHQEITIDAEFIPRDSSGPAPN